MTTAIYRFVLVSAMLLVLAAGTVAGVRDFAEFELNINGSSTDNLFKDWNGHRDRYSKFGLTTKLYPTAWAETKITTDYTVYDVDSAKTNFAYQLGITLVPLNEKSKTQLYLSANLKNVNYADINDTSQAHSDLTNKSDFTSKNYDATMSIGHEWAPALYTKAGYSVKVVGYDDENINDRYDHELFAAVNYSFLGSNAVDLELGYRFGDYDHAIDSGGTQNVIDRDTANSMLETNNLRWFYISPRYSRSLGKRTGISMTYWHRRFVDQDNRVYVFGSSSGLLSPWTNVYEGSGVQLKVKTYLVPKLTVTAAVGYWEKSYLSALEPFGLNGYPGAGPISPQAYVQDGKGNRDDIQRRINVKIQMPISTHSGYYLEPSLSIDYINNSSSVEGVPNLTYLPPGEPVYYISLYDYECFTVSLDFKVRF